MHLIPPADELAEIRAEIARLRAREGELREILLRDTAMPKVGRMHKVDLVTNRQRIFDPRLLPEGIRLDPAYTREKVTRVLRASRKPPLGLTNPGERAEATLRPAPQPGLFAGLTAHCGQ
jgi:hypothetical protein